MLHSSNMKASKRFTFISLSIFLTLVEPNLSWAAGKCSFVFLNHQTLQSYFKDTILSDLRTNNEIPMSELTEIKKLPQMGLNNDGIFSAQLNGQPVFLKSRVTFSNLSQGQLSQGRFLNEAAWTKLLSELRMGPQFYGIAYNPKTHFHFIITEFVSNRKFTSHAAISFPPESRNKFREAVHDLVSIGISPQDIQFYFTADGEVRFFDLGFYSWQK